MGTIVIIILLIVLILMFIPGKKEGNKINNDNFELLRTREYNNSTYFTYKINRNYKKVAQRLIIHGTTRHRDELEDFYDSHERELTFERETDNPRDSNAIKVLGDDEWLGYIPKENAKQLATLVDSGIQLIGRVDGLLEPTDKYPPNVSFSVWIKKIKKTKTPQKKD